MKRCYECDKNTCKMDPSLKNCKKIRNWIIGLKFFPLESESSLLHVKKIIALSTVSFLFYRLKMESFLYSLGSKQMRKKNCKMSWQKCGKCSENDVLNNISKLPLPPPGAFFMGMLTTWDYFFANISLDTNFCGKSFKQKLFLVKFPLD